MILKGQRLMIATMHSKELALQPIFQSELGVECAVAKDLNTDQFGMFTGEIDRCTDALGAARLKCETAAKLQTADFFVASEGSFGPHPELLFAPIAEELLLFSAPKEGLEILVKHLSMNTNFGHVESDSLQEIQHFAERHLFPSHKLILSVDSANGRIYRKGIGSDVELKDTFSALKAHHPVIRVESDMRAMNNPTRMAEIGVAAKKLCEKILSKCLRCQRPGFGITERIPGLPCGHCGIPTATVLNYKCVCEGCGFSLTIDPDHNKKFEDPMYCQFCNP